MELTCKYCSKPFKSDRKQKYHHPFCATAQAQLNYQIRRKKKLQKENQNHDA